MEACDKRQAACQAKTVIQIGKSFVGKEREREVGREGKWATYASIRASRTLAVAGV